MARAAVLGRLSWQVASVAAVRRESATARTLVLDVPDWPGHLAGQHVDIRLTAEDGYTAQRAYSIASSANGGSRIELTVDRLPDGEVSTYLTDVLDVGDQIELRGPLGGWFVWHPDDPRPVLLVGGGSGVVPLAAMLRARAIGAATAPFRLVYSMRSPIEEMYADDPALSAAGVRVHRVYTRKVPPGYRRPPERITADDLSDPGFGPDQAPRVFVCGPNGFVEAATNLLITLGHSADDIKTERFGPTGGPP